MPCLKVPNYYGTCPTYVNVYLELWVNFVSASVKGQPPYKGQKVCSQLVCYSEVLLYLVIIKEANDS